MSTLIKVMKRLNLNSYSSVKLIKDYNDEVCLVNINGTPFATTRSIADSLINTCNKD
jgi:hypothetical protein